MAFHFYFFFLNDCLWLGKCVNDLNQDIWKPRGSYSDVVRIIFYQIVLLASTNKCLLPCIK